MLCALSCLAAQAQVQEEAWSLSLDSVVVVGHRYSSPVKTGADGSIAWDISRMGDLPQLMGNADPMHYLQMLPGIQTNAEYQGGIHMQGSENSHNYVSAGGVPIYNAGHLLGFFSTFNASHYSSLSVSKTATGAASASRIGGTLDMEPPSALADSVEGEFSVGLVSSQGTVRMPLGQRTTLTASGRVSYVNLLYGSWLDTDEAQVKYNFFDTNLTLVHRPDDANTLLFDFYGGRDKGSFDETHYFADMNARWGNLTGALHWLHEGHALRARNSLYVTSYTNRFSLSMSDTYFALPSGITDIGYHGSLSVGRWKAGAEAVFHLIRPQGLEAESAYEVSPSPSVTRHGFEGTVYGDYTLPLPSGFSVSVGARANLYATGSSSYASLDPSVFIGYDNRTVQFNMGYALRHQYLFQTGFSNAGLPTEFWLPCGDGLAPQYAHGFSAGASAYLLERRFRLSADVFYKRLYHQIEYDGSVLDYVNTVYNPMHSLLHGDGVNYGFSIMLNKCSGKLNGWVSYAFTRTRRTFREGNASDTYPSGHDRPHELNAVLTYTPRGHWSFGGSFVYASGTPFTAPVSVSLLNGNVIARYGPHNANRLNPYMRLDLSANYKWKPRFARECGVNLSLYNVTSRRNDLFYTIKTRRDGTFAYRPVSFVFRILPSISYFCKF